MRRPPGWSARLCVGRCRRRQAPRLEGRGGLVGDAPELRQPGDQPGDGLIAEPRHAVDELGATRERRVRLRFWRRSRPRACASRRAASWRPRRGPIDDGRRLMLALLLDPLLHVFQRFPGLNQTGELLTRAIVRLGAVVGKGLGEPGDRLGVDRIVLGQPAGRLGEMADPLRIDDPNREPGRAQGFRPAALVTAARLHHHPADPVGSQPRHQLRFALRDLAPTGAAPANECRRRLCSSRHRGRQCASLVAYSHSLPCSYGLSRPCNCSGLWKTPDLSLASPQLDPVVSTGSSPSNGRLLRTAAR